MNYPLSKNGEWLEFDFQDKKEIAKVARNIPEGEDWLKEINESNKNNLKIAITPDYLHVRGSLIYHQNSQKENEYKVFHFYTCKDFFITVGLEMNDLKQKNKMLHRMQSSRNGVENFCILLSEITNRFLVRIDDFEVQLKNIVGKLQRNNNKNKLDQIFRYRQKLITSKSLLIPMEELINAIEETFLNEVVKTLEFNRVRLRIKRAMTLVQHYQEEMETLLHLEEAISSYRGNEIMKTLTVITTIFTPVMALGALWGMNFKHMPELEWKFGYLGSLILIFVSTIAIYFYLKFRGWTGGILKERKKKSLF
ncbi:magnesium transporter CorA family protein [Priestia filamentosa]|uniref:magnesium transporter CorA family protein n=1 Tax=Priestia filamentosa TaxID=1402861 RepID=UPI000A08CC15|nr:magnesium transporter CorA family protein [Priestia filamentosa]MDT3766111.1 magnesium transporter CorA family protein [Priestia filamentosa]WRU97925.1 magnesium transporter CorA family protein [Priestia filamentosa]SMF71074.1 Mg2+ and Co2+ transporter CorA [Priestia filamentosa]